MIIDTTNTIKFNLTSTKKGCYSNFNQKLTEGKTAEAIFEKFCKENLIWYELIDCSNADAYQKYDIDYILQNIETNQLSTVEIKKDWKIGETRNIFFEDHFDRKSGEGWFNKSIADWMFWVTNHPNMYGYYIMFDFWSIKQMIRSNQIANKQIKFWNKQDECYTYGYLVSLDTIKANVNYIDGYLTQEYRMLLTNNK